MRIFYHWSIDPVPKFIDPVFAKSPKCSFSMILKRAFLSLFSRSIIRALVPYPNSQIWNTEAPQVNTDPSRFGSATMGRGVSPDLYVMDPDPNPRFTEVGKSDEIF
jgi:hypothetical protein